MAAGVDVGASNSTPLLLGVLRTHGSIPVESAAAKVDLLIAAGANVNARVSDGYYDGSTALHLAAANSPDPAIVETLIAAGADLEARRTIDSNGLTVQVRTPLWEAMFNRNPDILRALLAAGPNVAGARLHNGSTSLHSAPDPTVVEFLLAAGVSLEARDAWGRTPLHRAANRYNRGPVTRALLDAGANVDARDEDGNTPLHWAANYNIDLGDNSPRHAGDAIRPLLEAGANPNATNAAGRTPWDLAQENEQLRGTDAYWRMNDARFAAPRQESWRSPATAPARRDAAGPATRRREGPGCEIPGYPTPADVQTVGLPWCNSSVGLQRRAFALQAAGAWCAIDAGSSSTPQQISARHQEINVACDRLDAMQALGGATCRCPAGYRP